MLVYGDRSRWTVPARLLDLVEALVVESRTAGPPSVRHDHLVAALIEAGMLAQGLADAEMRAAGGVDTASLLQAAAMSLVNALARAVVASWHGNEPDVGSAIAPGLADLRAYALPARIEVKQPEGFCYYALFPETYAVAARGLPADSRVIGLRSIGTTLAACVAAGAGCDAVPMSLRPVGPPFARHYAIDDDTWHAIVGKDAPCHALVDEGPGLSGSSLGALADRLEDAGVAAPALVMFPSHAGDLGPQSSARHRTRWSRVERRLATFDTVVLPRLAAAVEDLTGPAQAPLEDLSGGRWRRFAVDEETDWPPVNAMQERRKFLLQTDEGRFVLKFVGLGTFGRAALRDAELLHGAGFGTYPLGLRLGFMVSRWEERPTTRAEPRRADLLERLSEYLAFRTTLPPDGTSRADLGRLAEMTSYNIAAALGPGAAVSWRERYGDLSRLAQPSPVRTDNRMHGWEWFSTDKGRLLKADATDHCRSHDLIGCQDIVWDLAGAVVEFDLTTAELDALAQATDRSGVSAISRPLLAWMIPAYSAFQLGSWSMAATSASGSERQRIEHLIDRYRHSIASHLPA